ncbi:vacuolar protein sorting/targeting protein PEP1, partial [Linderina pennispora]
NPDWLLFVGGTACPGCHTEIWVSKDNGQKWNRITTHATKCLFARSKQFSNLPTSAVVCANYRHTSGSHNEQDRKGNKNHPDNYLEVRVFSNPFESSEYHPISFANPKESDVLDFYIYSRFLVIAVLEHMPDEQGHTTTQLKLYVSEDGKSVHEARFPPGVNLTPEGFTLLPTHGGTIIVDVEGAPSTGDPDRSLGWGTLFASNSNGTHFHLVIEHTNRNHLGFVDFDRVEGTEGLLMANRVLNTEALGKPGVHKQVQTVASRDDGRTWRVLEAPLKDSHGKEIDCLDCTLNLYGRASLISAGPLYGTVTAPGYMLGV